MEDPMEGYDDVGEVENGGKKGIQWRYPMEWRRIL